MRDVIIVPIYRRVNGVPLSLAQLNPRTIEEEHGHSTRREPICICSAQNGKRVLRSRRCRDSLVESAAAIVPPIPDDQVIRAVITDTGAVLMVGVASVPQPAT